MSAITKGKATLEEQMVTGGDPLNCPSLQIASFFTTKRNIDEFENKCLDGNSCHSCKKGLLKFILD
jgi:tryptophanyl-tRNA synthetase